MTKGYNSENELWNWFMDNGYAALRAPTSGGATDRVSPDIVALNETEKHAIEVKNRPDGTATFDREEIEGLQEWADKAGAMPWVVISPDLRTFDHWFCLTPNALHETPEGNYSIRKQDWDVCLSRTEAFL